jgi:hypothetical protein
MKTYIKIMIIAIFFMSCNNDDNKPSNPVDQLPPATQTGAQTIGCLVNGVPFTDSGVMNNFYQLIDGEYYLVINWSKDTYQGYKDGQLALNRIEIQGGQTYVLDKSSFIDGDYTGAGATFTSNLSEFFGQYETNENFMGKIHFTRFDTENFIMSGTFEFQAKEIQSGKTINITDGRFDLNFTN